MSKSNEPKTPDQIMYLYHSYAISDLEGRVLTFIDASITDPVQRKALKDLLRPMIWQWAIDNNVESYYELKQKPGSYPGTQK